MSYCVLSSTSSPSSSVPGFPAFSPLHTHRVALPNISFTKNIKKTISCTTNTRVIEGVFTSFKKKEKFPERSFAPLRYNFDRILLLPNLSL